MSTFFVPSLPDARDGGRLGGAPPVAIETHPLLSTHRYLLTLPAGCAGWATGIEVSVLLRDGFDIGDDDLVYPDMAMRALVHSPSPRGVRPDLGWPGLRSAGLTVPGGGGGVVPLVRIDDEPVLIQNEPGYGDAVRAAGHRFLFQIDEEGWPVGGELDDVIDEYLWGYGSVYFYGTSGAGGVVEDVVAGFIDF
ncbi:hypothetical protein [Gordonia sp. NB41Y]|uniref:hypothetical protein n=1 Tax=Gordonia sp. NB41Y TaxID=875808 RepID=UPI0002BDCDBD|nr:hypothetical protein [Gordonia sp. NB41Y]EMP15293.1 hypothetical protein ISGA_1307 [Gordonia sp. NB41Y]WLP89979.1 hypothetical protein Q9K23_20990 [Gordonia sp. NB41Y]